MAVLYLLIPVSIALASGLVVLCLTAIRKGQFDDLESPQWRILFDEHRSKKILKPTTGKSAKANPERVQP